MKFFFRHYCVTLLSLPLITGELHANGPLWLDQNSPIQGYRFIEVGSATNPAPNFFEFDPADTGSQKSNARFHFLKPNNLVGRPILLGFEFTRGNYRGIYRNFSSNGNVVYKPSNRSPNIGTRYVATGSYRIMEPPGLLTDLPSAEKTLRMWEAYLRPTIASETGNKWTVINTWDSAGVTPGILQMSARDGKDFLDLLTNMIENPRFAVGAADHPSKWFPEFVAQNGELYYRASPNSSLIHLRKKAYQSVGWQQNKFVKFFNPGCWDRTEYKNGGMPTSSQRRDMLKIDQQELEFTARWILWSQSKNMRIAQHEANIHVVRQVVARLAYYRFYKNGMLKGGQLPGSNGLDWACAYNLLHWDDRDQMVGAVTRLLQFTDPAQEFLKLRNYTNAPLPPWISPAMKGKSKQILISRAWNAYRMLYDGDGEDATPTAICRSLLSTDVVFDFTGDKYGTKGQIELKGNPPFEGGNFLRQLLTPLIDTKEETLISRGETLLIPQQ